MTVKMFTTPATVKCCKNAYEIVGQISRTFDVHNCLMQETVTNCSDNISTATRELCSKLNIPLNLDITREIEGLVALAITLRGCKTYTSCASAIFLYARSYYSGSICNQLKEYIYEILAIEPQSGDEKQIDNEYVSFMQSIQDNWNVCKSNKLFSNLSKITGLLVTLNLCKASALTMSVSDFKLFEPDLALVHSKTTDIVDVVLSTVTYFVEAIYMSIKTKSLKPFLYDSKSAVELDEEFANILLWWDLVKNGNLERVANVTESEFDIRLERLCTKVKPLVTAAKGLERKIMSDRHMKLLGIKNDYITLKISSGVRRSPFAIELYGESSQGKTTFGDQIVDALLCSAGLPMGKEYRASYNPSDKYMSNWATNKQVLFMDDVSNDKADFVERPPTRVIIDVCNNQPYYANMADLESKGKVFVEPALAIVNTNVKHLDAHVYSNCPYSIQRRMNAVITVKAKPQYQYIVDGKPQGIDASKIRNEYADKGISPTFDDIWVLTVEKARQPHDIGDLAKYLPISYKGQLLKDVSFRVVVQYLIDEFKRHRLDQDCILSRMRERSQEVRQCGVDGCNQMHGYCDKHCDSMENQWGEEITLNAMQVFNTMYNNYYYSVLSDIITPNTSIDSFCRYVYGCVNLSSFLKLYKLMSSIWFVFILFSCFICNRSTPYLFVLYICVQFWLRTILFNYKYNYVLRNCTLSDIVNSMKRKYVSMACASSAVIAVIYACAYMYKSYNSFKQQANLEPVTLEQIEKRDAEESPWTKVTQRSLPVSEVSLTTATDDLLKVVSRNLVYGSVVAGDKVMMVNGLYLKSNVVIIPSHYFTERSLVVTFRKNNPQSCGGKFTTTLAKSTSFRIPNTDFMLCYTPNGGSFRDLTRWFPLTNMPASQFTALWRSKDGENMNIYGLTSPCMTSNGVCKFAGGVYANLSIDTFKGMCGATLVSHGKAASIIGLHLGGRTGTKKGCYGCITQSQIATALTRLRHMESVMITGSAEQFEKQVLSVDVLTEQPLHPKSAVNYMPHDSQVEYLGSCIGRAASVTSVQVTPISEIVTEVTGVANKWGPPKFKPDWFGWQECLSNLSNPAKPYDHNLLNICIGDYKEPLIRLAKSKMWNDMRPLTNLENCCGIPGKKFVDAIQLDTSIGYPLTGPKRNYIVKLEPTDDYSEPWKFNDLIMKEINRCEDCYLNGQRAYCIAKACKKDEVLAKDKCRIFYSNPIALTFLIRKYYLPLIRFLQMNPLLSECAVGINSHGPEWDQFHKFVTHFGTDRIIGGDYGKYDQKIPSQLLLASLRILLDIAKVCDYKADDLKIMEAMAGDIVYAVIAFNGDLIGLTEGTHISGNSLTVVLNGICGSLNQRAYFFTLFDSSYTFRDKVKLMTYGDDNIGSVSDDIPIFGIQGLSRFLGQYGQIYTMPDKESELTRFLPYDQFEFLKRKSVYCPDKGCYIGALADKSIFKMLHCYMRDKHTLDTPELACAKNIDTALREWRNHGRAVYEWRRDHMKDIASRSNMFHLCTQLDVDYDAAVEEWKCKYISNYEGHHQPLQNDESSNFSACGT